MHNMYDFTDERPWGGYEILLTAADCQVKRLVVKPGQRCSYQVHSKRAEHWFAVSGEGVAVIDGEEIVLMPGKSIDIQIGQAHRIWNKADEDFVFIEVQTGTYFGEDDIERIEDDYKRA